VDGSLICFDLTNKDSMDCLPDLLSKEFFPFESNHSHTCLKIVPNVFSLFVCLVENKNRFIPFAADTIVFTGAQIRFNRLAPS